MLTFNVIFRCKPGMRETFLEKILAAGIPAAARAEEGNLGYDFYVPADENDDLLLIEKYTDNGAVMSHVQQPHTGKLNGLREEYVIDVLMDKFENGESMKF